MAMRQSHYELAFEAYLSRRGTPCVVVEDVKHLAKPKTGAKIFDYIVYPPGETACIVDVKGRKSTRKSEKSDCRQKTWVTRADVEGLQAWQRVFGRDYLAMFVFAYWLAEDSQSSEETGGGAEPRTFAYAGRHYSFWLVPVAEYSMHQKRLSKSWDTVSIPREVFRSISRRLESSWPAAPC
ncbi:MAG: HYExAFE family protein [Phycisphaerales bacterium]|nr:HYExAFE family protein [Phycisphaerales bacterium]